MNHLTADDRVLAILGQTKELTEVRDGTGNVVGVFAPAGCGQALLPAELAARLSRLYCSELEQRSENKDESRTTAEVFEYLRSLTPDEPTRAYLKRKIDGLKERDRCATP